MNLRYTNSPPQITCPNLYNQNTELKNWDSFPWLSTTSILLCIFYGPSSIKTYLLFKRFPFLEWWAYRYLSGIMAQFPQTSKLASLTGSARDLIWDSHMFCYQGHHSFPYKSGFPWSQAEKGLSKLLLPMLLWPEKPHTLARQLYINLSMCLGKMEGAHQNDQELETWLIHCDVIYQAPFEDDIVESISQWIWPMMWNI